MFVSVCVSECVYVFISIHLCTDVCMDVCVYVHTHTHVCLYVCVCVCIQTHLVDAALHPSARLARALKAPLSRKLLLPVQALGLRA